MIEVVDLTEDDDRSIRYSRSVADSGTASLASNSWHSPKKPSSVVNVKPIDLDAVASSTTRETVRVGASNIHAEELPQTCAYAFLNTPRPNGSFFATNGDPQPNLHKPVPSDPPAIGTFAIKPKITKIHAKKNEAPRFAQSGNNVQTRFKEVAMEASARRPKNAVSKYTGPMAEIQESIERVTDAQPEQRPPIGAASTSTLDHAVNGQTELGFGYLTSKSPSSRRRVRAIRRAKTVSAPLTPTQRHTVTPALPTRRTEPPSAGPQKRKRSSPGASSDAPLFRTPPKVAWHERDISNLAKPSVFQIPPKELKLPGSNQSPKSTSQSPLKAALLNDDSNKFQTPISRSPPKTTSFDESHSSVAQSSPLKSSSHEILATSKSATKEASALPNEPNVSLTTLQDEPSMGSESPEPILVSAISNFDRGRFPYQRRRRGAKEDLNLVPDYLSSPRINGWHHDGFADVKKLFKTVASDAVRMEKAHYKDWPIDLELATQKVAEKANDWASRRFGHFVTCLNMSSTLVPNSNDVEWLQRKVTQTFFEEATLANKNDTGQTAVLDPAKDEDISLSNDLGLARRVRGGTAANDEDSNSSGPSTQLNSKPTSSADTSPPVEMLDAPVKSHRSNKSAKSDRRPTRSAAYTAASRINSQYGMQVTSQVDGVYVPVVTLPRRLCPDCDCMISVVNFNVHLRSKKHKGNAQQAEERREESNKAQTIQDGAWPSRHQTAVPPSEVEPDPRSLALGDRAFAAPSTVMLQPRRKIVQGTYRTSLAASLAAGDSRVPRPYQGKRRRDTIDHVARLNLLYQAQLLQHVDFTAEEMAMIKGVTVKNGDGRSDITESLANAYADADSILVGRDKDAAESQIRKLDENVDLQAMRTFTMTESRVKDPNARPSRCIGSLLRHRELRLSATRRHVETQSELKIRLAEDIKPWRSFTGASHDVVALAWAPNSMQFAAGAVAHSNSEDLQYNRPCNLLLGDLCHNTLRELPDHRIDRQMPQTGRHAANQDLFNACDPNVYKTVTSVKFHPQGHQMYTASEDETVKIWDLSKPAPECARTLRHDAGVTSLDISHHHPGVFATASQRIRNAIRVFRIAGGQETLTLFSSSRAESKPEWKMYPEGLHWGPTTHTSHLLLGGFQEYGREADGGNEGHLCLWDVNTVQDLKLMPAAQAIHTAAWHPELPYFASGGAPGLERTDRQMTKTVVRVWDLRHTKRVAFEYECRAREMTDVTFSPRDPNIVTAGCTNSKSYVWDWRWPQKPLHELHHGKSVMPHGEKDTGIMMSLWGTGSSLFYTGSSDGSIRAWDIRRHPNDVLVHTVAQLDAGIQSGAFSPDGTHLLVGDATGGIHMLSSAPWEPRPSESTWDDIRTKGTPIDIIRASDGSGKMKVDDDNPGTEGIEAGHNLLLSGQLTLHPSYGPGKGPSYDGPYAMHVREEKPGSKVGRLKKEVYKQQPFSREGNIRLEHANPIRILAAARKELLDKKHKDDVEIIDVTPKIPDAPRAPGVTVREAAHLSPRSKIGMNEAKKLSLSGAAQALNKLERGHSFNLLKTPEQVQTATMDQCLSKPTEHSWQVADSSPAYGSGSMGPPTGSNPVPNPLPETNAAGSSTKPTGVAKHFAVRSQPSSPGIVVIDNLIPESEMVEENGWWPQLGEDEIVKARTRPGMRMG